MHFKGHWKGWALESETFLGPEMAMKKPSTIWAQKGQDFQGPPLPIALEMDVASWAGESKFPLSRTQVFEEVEVLEV